MQQGDKITQCTVIRAVSRVGTHLFVKSITTDEQYQSSEFFLWVIIVLSAIQTPMSN